MPRIPYKPLDISEPKDIVDAIRARRGGALLELDRILLYSPPVAQGWNTFIRAVRTEMSLPAKLRELGIIGVGVLNGADYEVVKHSPHYLAGGGTQAQLEALHRYEEAATDTRLFDETERAVMRLTIEMTRAGKVRDDTFAELRRRLPNPQHILEIVTAIAAYNMVSRVLIALEIEEE